jgi:tetratricopeptide (TPR) repeat protein
MVHTSNEPAMRRMIFFSILLFFTSLTGGCVYQTDNALPVIGLPPTIANTSFVNSGGTSVAIAFRTDEISTTSPEAKDLFLKGLTYLTQYARYNESLKYFDDAIALDQNFSEAWEAKGVAFHDMKRYDEAIKCYDKALEITPRDAGIWHLKGLAFSDWGKPGEAAACNRRAAELDPRYTIR